ncbi:HLA class II histocompatibility antigen, DQ beta 1 chain-like [Hypomesus transpacificus]|uniref:HLA class II histocompatibility antigen, DQ beta 1 chain-like n=1 Tax=Hypomesus transpacificus TaxID=137520 RepID=UPI001F08543F|nr:HLA class II histocompatibility antigen, DQ beta 1 chain-like [Hypomesus transpacificus]XP_046880911.1 HLA class II histocompatibility antigen, DQ beta 1 chain-like [Hypomesus transpacificus]
MSWSTIFFICMALVLSTQTADGYKYYRSARCVYSDDLHDMEFIDSYVFNKVEYIRFNSTVGLYVGLTEHGIYNADLWNKGPIVAQEKTQLEGYCKHNAANEYSNILDKHVKPSVPRLSSGTPSSGRHPAMLMCSAYDYYPKQIRVTWIRDGQEVTSDVTSTEELVDGDWYYQIHSQLEYMPKSGEKISCMVEHASLDKPIVEHWDPSLPESEKSKIAIGASGLVLGLVLSLAGLIYYQRKKSNGRTLVPSG